MKTYTITGVTGYIGSNLLKKLSKDNKVYAVVRPGSKRVEHENIEYVEYNETEESLSKALENSDYLVHLGALYAVKDDEETVKDLIKSNVLFSTQLFNCANRVNDKIVIVSASTFSSLDNSGNYAPASLYAATKKAVEDIARAFPLSIHFLTLPDTYGPGDWRPKIHNILGKNTQWPFTFRGPANQEIRLLHVEDVIGHLLASLEDNSVGVHIHDVYMEGTLVTLKELSKIVTDNKCLFNDEAVANPLPTSARSYSKETGYRNLYNKVEMPWLKKQ